MSSNPYDILIVGAGVAGSALAYALAMRTSKKRIAPLRIALLERSLSKPDRIVAELLQPGGVAALKKLGIESCLDEIGALPSLGFNLVRGKQVMCASFPGGKEGRTFDHGSFVMALRDRVRGVPNIVMIEATVTELIEDQGARRVIGVRASQAGGQLESHFADLVVLTDGSHSKFRTALLGRLSCQPTPQGHFAGFIVKDLKLPQSKYATCAVLKGTRPVIIYGLPDNKYRVLVGLKNPPPADVKEHILRNVIPQLHSSLRTPILNALDAVRIRRVPHFYLPPSKQGKSTKAGAFLLGDALNMRHPITAAGMTVALHDVVVLSDLLANVENFGHWSEVSDILQKWHYTRKPIASSINTTGMCLAGIFAGDSGAYAILQEGAFKFFGQGPEHVTQFMSLATGMTHSPLLLTRCSLAVTFYAILVLFTQPKPGERYVPGIYEYPLLLVKALDVVWTAVIVFAPVIWAEM